MNSQVLDFRAHEENLAQHEGINALIERIGAFLDQGPPCIGEVSDLLAQLGDRLVKHFAFEEEGGYFSDALLHAPQLIAKANALLAQHPKLHAQAIGLAANLQNRENADLDRWHRTAELFRAFRKELLRHEQQENGLLQEAYHQDIGIHD